MGRTKEIWIARDRDGEIYAFSHKPKLDGDLSYPGDVWDDDEGSAVELGSIDVLPNVTFENSPRRATVEAYHDALEESDITLID